MRFAPAFAISKFFTRYYRTFFGFIEHGSILPILFWTLLFFSSFPVYAARLSGGGGTGGSGGGPPTPGSTNYIQNTADPTTATQVFNVSSGVVKGLFRVIQSTGLNGTQQNQLIVYSTFPAGNNKVTYLLAKMPNNDGSYIVDHQFYIYASTYNIEGNYPDLLDNNPKIILTPPGISNTNGVINLLSGSNGVNISSTTVYIGRGDHIEGIVFNGYDCSSKANGGKLTTDSNGVVTCADASSGGGGGGSSLAIDQSGVQISSPTGRINFIGPPFIVNLQGSTSSQIRIDFSSITSQSDIVNFITGSSVTANYLTLSSASATYLNRLAPYVASVSSAASIQLTGTPSNIIVAVNFSSIPSRSDVILNRNTLQSGATGYPSFLQVGTSLTVNGQSRFIEIANFNNQLVGTSANFSSMTIIGDDTHPEVMTLDQSAADDPETLIRFKQNGVLKGYVGYDGGTIGNFPTGININSTLNQPVLSVETEGLRRVIIMSTGGLVFADSALTNYVGFTVSSTALATSNLYRIMITSGTSGQAILTDGNNNLYFGNVASSIILSTATAGATNYIFNQNALQSGSTAYPSLVITNALVLPNSRISTATGSGYFLTSTMDGSTFGTFFGQESGLSNVDTQGIQNTNIGYRAGREITTGSNNTNVGASAGRGFTTGNYNTCVGANCNSLQTNLGRAGNTFIGANTNSFPDTDYAMALGYNTRVGCSSCAVIGDTTVTQYKVGIGTNTPEEKLHIRGNFKVVGGSMAVSEAKPVIYLDSDNSNFVSFQSSSAITLDQKYVLPLATGTVDQILAIENSNVNGLTTLKWKSDTGGGGGANVRVEDGGSGVVTTSTMDFTGAQFVVTDNGGEALVALDASSVTLRGASGVIFNQNTLQSGATAYPSFAYIGSSFTVSGPVRITGLTNLENKLFSNSNITSSTHTIFTNQVDGLAIIENTGESGNNVLIRFAETATSGSLGNIGILGNSIGSHGQGIGLFNGTGISLSLQETTGRKGFILRSTQPIVFDDADNSNYVQFQSSDTLTSDQKYILPLSTGDTNQVLSVENNNVNGFQTLKWATPSGGSGDNLGNGVGAGITVGTMAITSLSPGVLHIVAGSSLTTTMKVSMSTETIGTFISSVNVNASMTTTANGLNNSVIILGVDPSSVTTLGQVITLGTETSGTYVSSLTAGGGVIISGTNNTASAAPIIGVDFSSVTSRSDAILNRNTLQSGATAYPSFIVVGTSGTILGELRVLGAETISLGADSILKLDRTGSGSIKSLIQFQNNASVVSYLGHSFTGGTPQENGIGFFDSSGGEVARVEVASRKGFEILNSGPVLFFDSDSSNFVALEATASVTSNARYVLPLSSGTADQVLAIHNPNSAGKVTTYWKDDTGSGSGSSIYNATTTAGFPFGLSMATGNITGLSPGVVHLQSGTSNFATYLVSLTTETVGAYVSSLTVTSALSLTGTNNVSNASPTLSVNASSVTTLGMTHASRHQDGGPDEISVTGLSGLLADRQNVAISTSGGLINISSGINFIAGTNVTITGANGGNGFTDITINASTSSGSGGGLMFASTNTVSVINTTAETSLRGFGVGTATFTANSLTAGKSFRVTLTGNYTTDATPGNFDFKFKIGNSTYCFISTYAWPISASLSYWIYDAVVTIRDTGSNGTAIVNSVLTITKENVIGDNMYAIPMLNTSTMTINTTVDNGVDVLLTNDMGVNTFRCTNFVIDSYASGSGGSGTPGGSDTQIQFNDSSAFNGIAGATINKNTYVTTLASANVTGQLKVTQGSNCGDTGEGNLCWDTDNDQLYFGVGSSTRQVTKHVVELLPEYAQFLSTGFPQVLRSTTSFPVFSLSFDDGVDESAFWKFKTVNYTTGPITVDVYWYASTATSGSVTWESQVAAINPNVDTFDVESKVVWGTVIGTTTVHPGTAAKRLIKTSWFMNSNALQLNQMAEDEIIFFRLARDANATNGADTLGGDARMAYCTITW